MHTIFEINIITNCERPTSASQLCSYVHRTHHNYTCLSIRANFKAGSGR